jgi:hypothetical protein
MRIDILTLFPDTRLRPVFFDGTDLFRFSKWILKMLGYGLASVSPCFYEN